MLCLLQLHGGKLLELGFFLRTRFLRRLGHFPTQFEDHKQGEGRAEQTPTKMIRSNRGATNEFHLEITNANGDDDGDKDDDYDDSGATTTTTTTNENGTTTEDGDDDDDDDDEFRLEKEKERERKNKGGWAA